MPSKEAIQTVVPSVAIANHAPGIPRIHQQTWLGLLAHGAELPNIDTHNTQNIFRHM
jgi:hypothetical protein